jgi:hypothetical protein
MPHHDTAMHDDLLPLLYQKRWDPQPGDTVGVGRNGMNAVLHLNGTE